jgi:hypothetical protein
MLGLGKSKAPFPYLTPPTAFGFTVPNNPLDTLPEAHVRAVRMWAADAWSAWHAHHDFIGSWANEALTRG